MGQKVNPNGLRIGINQQNSSTWYANNKCFANFLVEDDKIRKFIKKKYYEMAISKIVIDRQNNGDKTVKLVIGIHTGRPAALIGKQGAGVEELRKEVEKLLGIDQVKKAERTEVSINIHEVKAADADATLVAESIAKQLEGRGSFRRVMKQAMSKAMRAGAKGIKTMVSGRLDGAEIARSEQYREGSIPLQTLRADIDYGVATARTTFGAIGVKVWIYKGEILGKQSEGGRL